jgi:hypothetical protein
MADIFQCKAILVPDVPFYDFLPDYTILPCKPGHSQTFAK